MTSAVAEDIRRINVLIIAEDLAAKFPCADDRVSAVIMAAAGKAATLGAIDHNIRLGRCADDVAGPRTAITMELAELLLALGPLARIADTIALRTFADAYRAITEALANQPAAGSA